MDTSTWIRHFRIADPRLAGLLLDERVATCEVVLGDGAGALVYSVDDALRRVWRDLGFRLP